MKNPKLIRKKFPKRASNSTVIHSPTDFCKAASTSTSFWTVTSHHLLPNCEDAKVFNFNAGMQKQKLNIYCTLIWVPLYLSFWQCRTIPNKTGFTFFSWEKIKQFKTLIIIPLDFIQFSKQGGCYKNLYSAH